MLLFEGVLPEPTGQDLFFGSGYRWVREIALGRVLLEWQMHDLCGFDASMYGETLADFHTLIYEGLLPPTRERLDSCQLRLALTESVARKRLLNAGRDPSMVNDLVVYGINLERKLMQEECRRGGPELARAVVMAKAAWRSGQVPCAEVAVCA